MIKKISIKTKFGWISAFEENSKICKVKFGKYKNTTLSKNLKNFKSNLNHFLSKKNMPNKLKIYIEGNSVQKKIWTELKKIKFGKTKSYGDIAKKYNLSPRHVGKICSQNKILLVIPCHRVIKSDGSIGGFSAPGGSILKKKLLKFEQN